MPLLPLLFPEPPGLAAGGRGAWDACLESPQPTEVGQAQDVLGQREGPAAGCTEGPPSPAGWGRFREGVGRGCGQVGIHWMGKGQGEGAELGGLPALGRRGDLEPPESPHWVGGQAWGSRWQGRAQVSKDLAGQCQTQVLGRCPPGGAREGSEGWTETLHPSLSPSPRAHTSRKEPGAVRRGREGIRPRVPPTPLGKGSLRRGGQELVMCVVNIPLGGLPPSGTGSIGRRDRINFIVKTSSSQTVEESTTCVGRKG